MPLRIYPRGRIWHCRGTVAGKLVRESLKTGDRALAEHLAHQIEGRILREKVYGPEAEATFADACNRYFADNPVRPGAKDQMSAHLAVILGELGTVKLRDITPAKVRGLAKRLHPTWKPQSLNVGVLAPVSAVINHAHQYGFCNPIRIKRFAVRDERIARPIDEDWLYAFARAAPPHLGAFALFCFKTGSRPAEALKLRPEHFDLRKGIAIGPATKNGKRREYHLPDDLVAVLWNLPPVEIKTGKRAGEITTFGFACAQSLFRPWRKVCKAAGLDYRTRYEAGRHSHFTHSITRHKADIPTASKLGNITPQVALRRYAHAEAPERLAQEIFGTKSAQAKRWRLKLAGRSKG